MTTHNQFYYVHYFFCNKVNLSFHVMSKYKIIEDITIKRKTSITVLEMKI